MAVISSGQFMASSPHRSPLQSYATQTLPAMGWYKYSQWGMKNVLAYPPCAYKTQKALHSSVIQKEIVKEHLKKQNKKKKEGRKKKKGF